MVQSLIQRIRENKLDALYLFINESLRDRNEFDVFFHNLMVVLPNNWSINRVEIGHEFLSRTAVDGENNDDEIPNHNNENNSNNNNNNVSTESKQDQLFRWVCSLESLRSLIISDGYIPRKDHGFVDTKALLRNLPRANNLQYLDVQRLKLRITGDSIENDDTELLAESLDSLRDSLEDLRLTAISMCDTTSATPEQQHHHQQQSSSWCGESQCALLEQQKRRYPLDATIRVCGEMANLQLLAISCASGCGCNSDNGEDQHQQNDEGLNHRDDSIPGTGNDTNGTGNQSPGNKSLSPSSPTTSCLISKAVLLQLCRSSSTLQELALRSMRIDDDTCKTIAKAFDPPDNKKNAAISMSTSCTSLPQLSSCDVDEQDNDDEYENDMDSTSNHHSPSFWTSLDLRQNPSIGTEGYEAILSSLERNYDLWCSLMVDNDSFQSKFNALIELNQANRGALVRSPSPEKLAVFLDRLKDDPTALWYFLTIHRDAALHPLIRYLKWKNSIVAKNKLKAGTITGRPCHCPDQQQLKRSQGQHAIPEFDYKRPAALASSLPSGMKQIVSNTTTSYPTNPDKTNETAANVINANSNREAAVEGQNPCVKKPRLSAEITDRPRHK